MLMSNGKYDCCNNIFTDVTASKEYFKRIQIIFILRESAFHWLFCLKFSFKSVTFLRVSELCKKKMDLFF